VVEETVVVVVVAKAAVVEAVAEGAVEAGVWSP
jgi:hypothetical protein